MAFHHDVNRILLRLLWDVQNILGDDCIGIYVHGSLAMGSFDPGRSDIDFLVVTRGELNEEQLTELEAMHEDLTNSGLKWAKRIEGSYIPQAALRRHDPSNAVHPAVGTGGHFHMMRHGADWVIQRHIIREQGVKLHGPPPATLIDPVALGALSEAARGILAEWWAPQLDDPRLLEAPEYQSYAVLTMCRALYTIAQDEVVSKVQSVDWALQTVDERWHPLIEAGAAWHYGQPFDDLDAVLAFIRFTLEQVGIIGTAS